MNNDDSLELASYKRALERERKARKIVESQLEDFSREIYQSNTLLREQTQQAQLKQKHLAFLASVAEDIWLCDSLEELIDKYLKRSCDFLEGAPAAFIKVDKDHLISSLSVINPLIGEGTSKHNLSKEQLTHLFQSLSVKQLKQDFYNKDKGALIDLNDYAYGEEDLNCTDQLFLFPMFHQRRTDSHNFSFVCFFFQDSETIDYLKLQTIESSHAIFSAATERKKAESALKNKLNELQASNQELQQIQKQLIESEKLASLGLLSAGIAHEINNPVGFVSSNLAVMQEYMEELKEQLTPHINLFKEHAQNGQYGVEFTLEDTHEILSSSLKGLERVKDIVSDLSAFSRMDTDELSPVDVNQVINSALNILHNELKYKHQVVTQLAPGLEIFGIEGQLQQVFINFFINAKQAMPEGGCLTVVSKKVKERVIVTIKDEGSGIDPDAQKEIFTPFFTTKPPGEGTGLGLSISYGILQRHHAKIDIDSTVGEGTEFRLSFIATHS